MPNLGNGIVTAKFHGLSNEWTRIFESIPNNLLYILHIPDKKNPAGKLYDIVLMINGNMGTRMNYLLALHYLERDFFDCIQIR